jgi:hypothetical protein
MKKIILSAIVAFSAVTFLPSSSKAQTAPKAQSTSTGQPTTNRALPTLEPTNALMAWAEAYQYGMSHGFGLADSQWYANARMKVWIANHGG